MRDQRLKPRLSSLSALPSTSRPASSNLRWIGDRTLLIFLFFIALRLASGPTANVAYLAIAVYAMFGRRQAIEALLLSFLFTQLNVDLFPTSSFSNVGRYLVVFASFISVFGRKKSRLKMDGALVATLFFGAFAIIHSIAFSLMPAVSVLKVSIWFCAMLTMLVAWRSLDESSRERLAMRVLIFLSATVVVSVALSFLPGAYLPRTSLLRGVYGHSQMLGAVAVIVAVWAIVQSLGHKQPPWWLISVAGVASFAVLGSGTRTALVTLIFVVPFIVLLARLGIGRLRPLSVAGLSSKRIVAIAAMFAAIIAVNFESVSSTVRSTIIKSGNDASTELSLASLYMESRGGLIGEMLANVERDPIIGIGFGIASNPAEMEVSTVGGIPIGAVVEKGVTILAVWEELGAIGLIIFVFWTVTLMLRAAYIDTARLAVLVTILCINAGEASLLSAGGLGLIQIILIGWVASKDGRAVRRSEVAVGVSVR